MGRRRLNDDVARFWAKVKMGQLDECWLWQGARQGKYGSIFFNSKSQGAHRVSYQINCGPIPDGYDVLHRCDNPLCVNPAHLWIGTHGENMRDMEAKGRSHHDVGSENPAAKLDEAKVREIRQLLKEGFSHRELGERYGVTSATITYINVGATWRHV